MINIKTFVCNMLQENCYVVNDDSQECVVIDCGAYYEEERQAIVEYIHQEQLKPVHLLVTHGHLDHNFGNNTIYEAFGLQPELHPSDASLMTNLKNQAKSLYRLSIDYTFPAIGRLFEADDVISFGRHTFSILHTPGHSRGSVCFYCKEEDVLFSGDTLFERSIGRTDFDGGSMMQIIQSLRMLAQLPDATRVFPGHGRSTTIGRELQMNPYLDR